MRVQKPGIESESFPPCRFLRVYGLSKPKVLAPRPKIQDNRQLWTISSSLLKYAHIKPMSLLRIPSHNHSPELSHKACLTYIPHKYHLPRTNNSTVSNICPAPFFSYPPPLLPPQGTEHSTQYQYTKSLDAKNTNYKVKYKLQKNYGQLIQYFIKYPQSCLVLILTLSCW